MTDQVGALNREPTHFQIGEPGAPCGGSSTCTDCSVAVIVYHETGRKVTAAQVRKAGAPGKDPCRGLNPTEALRALVHFGVTGYVGHVGITASEAIRATDDGIVLLAVGYDGFPTEAEAEVGGKVDIAFRGPHAITLWGRRNYGTRPASWPKGKTFRPGWRVWTRDPDHHFGAPRPPYDRFRSAFLVRAMDALVGNEGWQSRFALVKRPAVPRVHAALAGIQPHALILPAEILEEPDDLAGLPDFGVGQTGGGS